MPQDNEAVLAVVRAVVEAIDRKGIGKNSLGQVECDAVVPIVVGGPGRVPFETVIIHITTD
jgi:hypothetical protein